MEVQPSTFAETESSTIVVTFTRRGVQLPVIHADSEEAQIRMQGLLNNIAPCLDVASAIIKRDSTEPTV